MTAAQYESLLAISDAIHPLFALALIVGHETGHRIGAVRLLRWADLDLERQLVRRRGETRSVMSTKRGSLPRPSRLYKPHVDRRP